MTPALANQRSREALPRESAERAIRYLAGLEARPVGITPGALT